jgi:acetyl-CoA C-acetyltransferase
MNEAWIIDACRTPRGVGKVGKGALSELHTGVLGAATLRALAERNELDTSQVDDVIWGCSLQVGTQGGALGRMTALDAGWETTTSGMNLDRYCGSGITAVNLAAGMVASGFEDVVVAGGAEMMSSYAANQSTTRHPFMDKGNDHLRELHPQSNQGVAADAIATLQGISREALDELGVESQRRAAQAIEEGRFDKSLVPVHAPDGRLLLDREEYPRPGTTLEKLSQLQPAFEKVADIPLDEQGSTYRSEILRRYPDLVIEHVHHAGTSSGVVDGAGALLIASPDAAGRNGWTPRARIVATANVGDDPTLMLNAPVPAARKVLEKAGMTLDDIDLFEVNEAFAVVVEKFIRDLDIDRDRINVNGGAIALGHPIGATGSMLIGTLLDELERRDLKRGLVTMCAAGGMAPAILIERG